MNSLPALEARPRAGVADLWFGPWLAALALGLAALGCLVLVQAEAGPAAPGSALRPIVAVMAAHRAPASHPAMHRAEWDGTALTADIEAVADPAMPGFSEAAEPARGTVPAPFAAADASLPSPAPVSSLLRPPRAA